LECPRVVAGSVDDNGNQVKFGGFDWFDLANDQNYGDQNQYPYPDGTLPDDTGVHWYKDCLIEIYTPRPSLHDEFWYEIGETRPVVRRQVSVQMDSQQFSHTSLMGIHSL
jgi:hypothetical protein